MKKGFTLVEVLVSIVCASIALLMITTTLILIINLNNNIMDSSSNYYKVSTIREYVTKNCNEDNYNTIENSSNGDIIFNEYTIVNISNIQSISTSKTEVTSTSNTNTNIITIKYELIFTDDPSYTFYVILKGENTDAEN